MTRRISHIAWERVCEIYKISVWVDVDDDAPEEVLFRFMCKELMGLEFLDEKYYNKK